jgi:hypothetical protein
MDDLDEILGVSRSPERESRAKARPIPMDGTPIMRRTAAARKTIDLTRADVAAHALGGLPADNESWHGLMSGAWDGYDLVDAILIHASPARIGDLWLATLGFNAANAQRLLSAMDAGVIGPTRLLVSHFYESDYNEADVCNRLRAELPARGGWYCATRTHAKIIAARLTDGRAFVVESSANLRTCRAIEQFTLTQSADLLRFHTRWMEDAHARDA